ncbi:MAG TPA: xanthine dehydrogenase molybdopterin binding subunit [Hyphomicrobiaceae bacterium]|nr:xanthine dehydrogenase molybdopterin binding subunit [Hyphomicrobiaceae bacterium]
MHAPKVNVSTVAIDGGVRAAQRHDSGEKHVSGEAIYVDDMREPPGTLHIYIAMSARAHAVVKRLELERVRAQPGVAIVLTAKDVPGVNDVSPFAGDDPVFADGLVQYHGQSLFAVAADTMAEARGAARLAVVEYEDKSALLTVDEAMQAKSFLEPPCSMERGDARAAIAAAPHMLEGRFYVGGQEHFYLEGQVAFAVPGEDEEVTLHCSSQHPSEIQHKVARVLGVPNHAVTVEVRRMGGGFGGKESQGNLPAAVAALVAKLTGRPAKCCYDRDDDMMITGKRHDFRVDYRVGFDGEGRILGIEFEQAARCGMSIDLSLAIADRAMFHADNAYYLPAVRITSYRCKTHTQSNTAFRGFGGPQGMAAMEHVIEEIAHVLACDPLDVRRCNFYDPMGARPVAPRNLTPYSQTVEDCVIEEIVEELEASSEYRRRRREIREWNALSPVLKRGIALTPVKFGISFTNTMMNQAGALVHVYADGSIALNHGGTEMGQGLNTKVAQVVAEEFQVDIARIKITATQTGKVPNTSATAASSGSDLNGMAARGAAQTIKGRLAAFLAERYQAHASDVLFRPNRIRIKDHELSFDEAVGEAYRARVHLSATGFYATPKIHWDRASGRGRPFFYFAYGAAVSEVAIDTLTGENRILRTDILHDVGQSLNPAIDLGQVEGGFVQGAGWLTMEELVWDARGRLLTHAPSTYKIPACSDRPIDLRMKLWDKGRNPEETIYRSKAVGEPPLMLAISVLMALTDAVASVGDYQVYPALDAPATPERVLTAIERIKQQMPARSG